MLNLTAATATACEKLSAEMERAVNRKNDVFIVDKNFSYRYLECKRNFLSIISVYGE
jgi:hypothetical protein